MMQQAAILGSKVVIVLIMACSVAGQILVIPLMAAETVASFPEAAHLRVPGIIGCVAIVMCAQIALVCVWRLLSMVDADSIFSDSAFRLVDLIIGAGLAVSVLCVAAWVILSVANMFPPGVAIMLITGILGGLGFALLMLVMRGLLRKATELQRDLSEVI